MPNPPQALRTGALCLVQGPWWHLEGMQRPPPQQFLDVEIGCAARLGVGSFAPSQLAWKFGKFGLPRYGTDSRGAFCGCPKCKGRAKVLENTLIFFFFNFPGLEFSDWVRWQIRCVRHRCQCVENSLHPRWGLLSHCTACTPWPCRQHFWAQNKEQTEQEPAQQPLAHPACPAAPSHPQKTWVQKYPSGVQVGLGTCPKSRRHVCHPLQQLLPSPQPKLAA